MSGYKGLLKKFLRHFGYDLVKSGPAQFPVEATEKDRLIGQLTAPFTMTSAERIWAVINSVNYIVSRKISGDFVECGVWRGGSAMAIAYKLKDIGVLDRTIWLYDTFTGMTAPSNKDIEAHSGRSAEELLEKMSGNKNSNFRCISSKDEVAKNISITGYPSKNIRLIEGDVLTTLDSAVPEEICLLRLDTDWYESTKKELQVLYPRLASGGVCIVDDYGHWRGAKPAVDEYFSERDIKVLLHPIDDTGRIFIKP